MYQYYYTFIDVLKSALVSDSSKSQIQINSLVDTSLVLSTLFYMCHTQQDNDKKINHTLWQYLVCNEPSNSDIKEPESNLLSTNNLDIKKPESSLQSRSNLDTYECKLSALFCFFTQYKSFEIACVS